TPKGTPLKTTLIETKGEGGYCICAPSNGTVHETGKPYVLMAGRFSTIATITPEERALLVELARTFDECKPDKEPPGAGKTHARQQGGSRPGDDYNRRATWGEVLEPHGWRHVYERNGEAYWCRPGKERGVSATTNYQGSELLYVFSTSTDFE